MIQLIPQSKHTPSWLQKNNQFYCCTGKFKCCLFWHP